MTTRSMQAPHGTAGPPEISEASPRVDLTHLPAGAVHFFGRNDELAELDAAFSDGGRTQIVELIAAGGAGKTALVSRWLDRLKSEGWRGARQVYGWSFFSQGTPDDRQASEDDFIAEALKWFGVAYDTALSPWDKGELLAEEVRKSQTLLVLDGVEPLQCLPGPLAGEFRAPGLKTLLQHLASPRQPGLCVLTSRVGVKDLAPHERNAERPDGGVVRKDLGNLSEADGAQLLHRLGVRRAGAATIGEDDEELRSASREVHGHALTLALLGGYLHMALEGDVLRRGEIDFRDASAQFEGGRALEVVEAFERWLAQAGEEGERLLATWLLLGFFDRPAAPVCLTALRAAPAIGGLTEKLVDLGPDEWRATLKRLEDCGLILPVAADGTLDAHPLVREVLAGALRERLPDAWHEGHRRIHERLRASVPCQPASLVGLRPLYQAVAHGCLAGMQEETCEVVFKKRILRGTGAGGYYSTIGLGAVGADLAAIACFFDERWRRPSEALSEANQAWLLDEAAFRLRDLGRLEEAAEPMAARAEAAVRQEDWKNAAVSYGNLTDLRGAMGELPAALADAARSVEYADRSGDASVRLTGRTNLADALHQHGEGAAAEARFAEAEAMHAERQPEFPLLFSLSGFAYCDLLLSDAERAAWHGQRADVALMARCREVVERAERTLRWVEAQGWLIDIALDHLSIGRSALYTALLLGGPPDAARAHIDRAVAGLRAPGQQQYMPRGLLTRAWLRHSLGDASGARADLEEAWQIASRRGMRLFMADVHLTRARLFREPRQTALDHLAKARALIEGCEYVRRLPELEDAETALRSAPH